MKVDYYWEIINYLLGERVPSKEGFIQILKLRFEIWDLIHTEVISNANENSFLDSAFYIKLVISGSGLNYNYYTVLICPPLVAKNTIKITLGKSIYKVQVENNIRSFPFHREKDVYRLPLAMSFSSNYFHLFIY